MMNNQSRQGNLIRFYSILDNIKQRIGGVRKLADCSGRMSWPKRGVYFFFEEEEKRSVTGSAPRGVRIGTHALNPGSRTKLWTRLYQHKWLQNLGGGNHRGSIFRLIVGKALIKREGLDFPTWGIGNTAPSKVRQCEIALERRVSQFFGNMSFLWLAIEDEAGPNGCRGYIERNSIALLSNFDKPELDRPSKSWLGHYSDKAPVRKSGLWNQNHVNEICDPSFIDTFRRLISDERGKV